MSEDFTNLLWEIAKQQPYKRGASHVVPTQEYKADKILSPTYKSFVPDVLKQIGNTNGKS